MPEGLLRLQAALFSNPQSQSSVSVKSIEVL